MFAALIPGFCNPCLSLICAILARQERQPQAGAPDFSAPSQLPATLSYTICLMAFEPVTRLGNYEIIGRLGAGGMGEVFRARDLQLGREVAIKVLNEEASKNEDRLKRFFAEARATS